MNRPLEHTFRVLLGLMTFYAVVTSAQEQSNQILILSIPRYGGGTYACRDPSKFRNNLGHMARSRWQNDHPTAIRRAIQTKLAILQNLPRKNAIKIKKLKTALKQLERAIKLCNAFNPKQVTPTPTHTIAPTTAPIVHPPTPIATIPPSATPTRTPTATPAGEYTSSISQYGVTWTFDQSYRYGRFANGDYWVVPRQSAGKVTVIDISPTTNGGRHGWQVNPVSLQAFDNRISSYNASLQPSLPYEASAGSSIIKAVSKTESSACSYNSFETCYLKTTAVLTVLDAPPEADGAETFRPAYWGTTKQLYSTSSLRTDLLPSVGPAPTGAPSIASLNTSMSRMQLDVYDWNWRPIHPEENGPNYGADIARVNGDVALRLMLNDSLSQKMPLLLSYVQYGIDLYQLMLHGSRYPANGGHGAGRKLPLAFAAVMLDDPAMKSFVSTSSSNYFGENGEVFTSSNSSEPLFGEFFSESGYWDVLIDYDATGSRTTGDPYGYIDGGHLPGTSYQSINLGPAKGTALAVRLMSALAPVFNNAQFLRYLDRWADVGSWTQPDPCAPMTGLCVGGASAGASCTSATTSVCGTGVCNYTLRRNSDFGTLYGPNGNGGCILDSDSSDGTGRFPQLHGSNRDVAAYGSGFARDMWNAYRH